MPQELHLEDLKTSPKSKLFSGRPRGAFCRNKWNLDQKDQSGDYFTVIIPPDTYSINMSFFLGLFGPSVRYFGKEDFKRHYRFINAEKFDKSFEEYIDEALNEGLTEKKTA